MGYSLPAAIGAAYWKTGHKVISFSGDGGFQMNIQELATIRAYNLPIVIAVFNNGNLGMVKQWQDLFWNERHSTTIFEFNPDFTKIAEAYGISAIRVERKGEVPIAIEKALKTKDPILLEFVIEQDAHVYPMIPANDIIEGGDR